MPPRAYDKFLLVRRGTRSGRGKGGYRSDAASLRIPLFSSRVDDEPILPVYRASTKTTLTPGLAEKVDKGRGTGLRAMARHKPQLNKDNSGLNLSSLSLIIA